MVGGVKKTLASLYASTTGRRRGVSKSSGRGRGRGRQRSPSPLAASSSGEDVPSVHEEHEVEAEEHEVEAEEQHDGEERQEEEQQEGDEEDTSAVWLRGPSHLPKRPIAIDLRPLIRPIPPW